MAVLHARLQPVHTPLNTLSSRGYIASAANIMLHLSACMSALDVHATASNVRFSSRLKQTVKRASQHIPRLIHGVCRHQFLLADSAKSPHEYNNSIAIERSAANIYPLNCATSWTLCPAHLQAGSLCCSPLIVYKISIICRHCRYFTMHTTRLFLCTPKMPSRVAQNCCHHNKAM